MASSPAPSTPENAPRRIPINRSFTVPAKISSANRPSNAQAEIGATEGLETLYRHPDAKIIKFTTSAPLNTSSSSPSRPQSSSGALPWVTPTDRTLAVGPLEIYRVPGSCSFLRFGNYVQAILQKSPCWCVDGASKFVLRVSPNTYNRIELPGESEEDLEEVERLKITLQKVLAYEKMPCPFARTFSVDIPEEPEVKKRRRKSTGPAKKWKLDRVWRPEGWEGPERRESDDTASASGSSGASEDESGLPSRQEEAEVASPAQEVKETVVTPSTRSRALAALRSVSSPQQPTLSKVSPSRLRTRVALDGTIEVSGRIEAESRDQGTPRLRTFQAIPTDMPPSPPDSSAGAEYVDNGAQSEGGATDERVAEREGSLSDDIATEDLNASMENVTIEEPQVAPEDAVKGGDTDTEAAVEQSPDASKDHDEVVAASSDTEGGVDAPDEASAASPLQANVEEAVEENSEPDVFECQRQAQDDDTRPSTPENQTTPEDPYAAIQARILARRSIGGTTSFYPGQKSPTRQSTSSASSTATISSNKSTVSRRSHSSHRQQAFASAMVKKACSVFLGPPAHLVAIMLSIAARFANGAFGVDSMFYVETPVNSPRKVPGSYHLAGHDMDELDSDREEDDFGVPLRSPQRLRNVDGMRERRGWDVD